MKINPSTPGTGLQLDSARKALDALKRSATQKEASNDENVPAGTKEAAEEAEDTPLPEPSDNEMAVEPDESLVGEDLNAVTIDTDPSNTEPPRVKVRCNATACIFNQVGHCANDSILIDFNPNRGMATGATECDSFTVIRGEE